MNYYEHHLGDYMRDTAHLSLMEDGVNRRLLDHYYIKELPIPADMKDACRLVRATTKAEREAVAAVLAEFFVLRDDGWHQKRCDAEIARFQDKQRKAKASADARWNAQRAQCDGNANASTSSMRTQCEGNAHQSPVTSHQTPKNDADASPRTAPVTESELWEAGSSLLAQAGMKQPRPFIGKLVKDHGAAVVMEAIGAAIVAQPADPAAYIRGGCRTKPVTPRQTRSRHTGFAHVDYSAEVRSDGRVA